MKIIISPSKTMKIQGQTILKNQALLYPEKNQELLSLLQSFNKEELKSIMKIKNRLLDETYSNLQNYDNLPFFKAFDAFYGLVYKGLQKELYHEEEYEYINKNIVILDAFYGLLLPGNLIKQYRLDMKMKIGVNLYQFWDVTPYFKDEQIINLASQEFSKMINHKKMVNISFLEHRGDSYVNLTTYSKQARGKFLNFLIINKITEISAFQKFNEDNYTFNKELSSDLEFVFTR